MKEVTAVGLRQSLGRIARKLERDGEPIMLRLGGRRVGVIISIKDFRERFSLKVAEEERDRLVEEILANRIAGAVSVDEVLDELRQR